MTLVLENFITVIKFLFGMGLCSGFWAAEHLPPLCQQAASIQCVKYGNTYTLTQTSKWSLSNSKILTNFYYHFN